jgi:hypothetical protein
VELATAGESGAKSCKNPPIRSRLADDLVKVQRDLVRCSDSLFVHLLAPGLLAIQPSTDLLASGDQRGLSFGLLRLYCSQR